MKHTVLTRIIYSSCTNGTAYSFTKQGQNLGQAGPLLRGASERGRESGMTA